MRQQDAVVSSHGAAPKKEGDGLKCAMACQLVETLELVSHLRHQRVAHRFEGESVDEPVRNTSFRAMFL